MANQITVTGSLAYVNTSGNIPSDNLSVFQQPVSLNGTNSNYIKNTFFVGTATDTALPLGGAGQGTLGWVAVKNLDPANSVALNTASGSGSFGYLLAGEQCQFRFNPSVTAPAARAILFGTNTGSGVSIEYMILPY